MIKKFAPAFLLLTIIVISLVLLPAFGKNYFGLFTTWDLFSVPSPEPHYDMILKTDDGEKFFTDISGENYIDDSYAQWTLVQNLSRQKTYELHPDWAVLSQKILNSKMELISFCQMTVSLPEYILMTTEEKKAHCASQI